MRHVNQRRWRPWTAAALVLVSLALAACTSRGGSASSADSSSSGPDLAFYRGQTITWDVPDPPGTGFYDTAAILAPALGKYLHATVNTVSIPAGATVAGQDQAAVASPNGLTFGTMNISADVSNAATKQPNVNFDITKEEVIAGLPINPEVFVVQPSSSDKTWSALVSGTASMRSVATAGSNQVLEEGIYGSWGVKAKLVTGYENVPEEVAGFLRGDGSLGANSVTTFASAISAGKARPLLVTGPVLQGMSGYAQMKSVPDLATLAAQDPPATASGKAGLKAMEALFGATAVNQVYFCPPGTPQSRVEALTIAVKAVLAEASTRKAFIQQNLTPGYLSPAQSRAAIAADVKEEPAIAAATATFSS